MEAVSVLFSLASMCLVIAGAASPWLSFQAPNAPQLTFGLLTFCSSGNCVAMSQAPYTGDLCELKAAAALLFIAFIFAFLSLLTGATLAAGSDALIADHKLKIVFSLSALLLTFIGCVIACNQVRAPQSLGRGPAALLHSLFLTTPLPLHHSLVGALQVYPYYTSQNNQFMSLDSAPKYMLQPGFSCTISSLLLFFITFTLDVVLARRSRSKSEASGPVTSAATLRSSPTHITHYHVTSPLSVASASRLADQ